MDKIEMIMEKYKKEKGTLISLLQDINSEYKYLPEEILTTVSLKLNIPVAKLYGLATFYKSFRLKPLGEHHICLCVGTACHVNGASKLEQYLERDLKINQGETTTDKKFSFETVNCIGACALGPLVVIDGEYQTKIDQNKLQKLLKKYKRS